MRRITKKNEAVNEEEERCISTVAEDERDGETMPRMKTEETVFETKETEFVEVSDAVDESDSAWANEPKVKVEVMEAVEEIKDTRRKRKAARVRQEPQSAFSQFCRMERARAGGRGS